MAHSCVVGHFRPAPLNTYSTPSRGTFSLRLLTGFAKHYQTGEPLPDGVFEKLLALKHYNAGLGMLRQLYFGEYPTKSITVGCLLTGVYRGALSC